MLRAGMGSAETGGVVDTPVESSGVSCDPRGGCPPSAGTLPRLVAAVPRPEGCPGIRVHGCSTSLPGVLNARQNALLAQSVEHSHGKAGVVGSIPTEGSTKWSGNRSVTSQTPGGVAQLVRASGS